MAVDNTVIEVGNVTSDPDLKFTASGSAFAKFGLAVNRRWQNKQTNEWEEQVSFFNVTVWQQMAENVAESIVKGNRVVVVGRLEQRSWDDKETGKKQYAIDIIADEVAPSLKWATVQIVRNERQGPSEYGGGGGGNGNRASQAPEPEEAPF